MNSSQYRISQLKHLSSILGCKPEEIDSTCLHIEEHYKEWFKKKKNKSGEFKKYKDGTVKQRVVRPSVNRLKFFQSRIKNKILAPIPLSENVHGGVKGKSNITNAKPHKGKKYKFTTDLKDFFPGIKYNQVYHAFLLEGFSNHMAHYLTKLTTWKYELPQGTPTSTHIANLVFLDTDRKLISLCEEHKITYTRYIDDLTFSSPVNFKVLLNSILKIIIDDNFKINYRKTEYRGDQIVTGIEIFNNYIDVPKAIKVKAALEILSENFPRPYTNYMNAVRNSNKNIKQKIPK